MDNKSISAQTESLQDFRDRIATVDAAGKRIWVYPKKPKGPLTNARTWVSWFYLAIFFLMPFIKLNGSPLLLLNVIERKFIIFGMIFRPQDFHLFLIATITFMVFIVLFTVIYGRIFCGWMCPQTIFMEMVFRKIEYWIEGDWKKQMALDRKSNDLDKVWRKTLKHAVFLAISFLISNTFLAYIIGKDALFKIISEPVSMHMEGFISIILFTGVFYFVFSRFREQVCTTICPYGRLQGVLLDKDSIVVAYDHKRGEPRGLIRKNENRAANGKGDCIDCHHCVDVCPTGIDIRNGTQLECINCTACIDACNDIMLKIGQPKGLIRYASERNIAEGRKFRFTPRMIGYSVVLVALVGILFSFTANRSDVDALILRAPGMLYQEKENDRISNLFTYKLINKSHNDYLLEFRLEDIEGEIQIIGGELRELKREETIEGSMFLVLPRKEIRNVKTKVTIGIYSDGILIKKVNTNFMGPAPI